MADPVILLPARLEGVTLSQVAGDVAAQAKHATTEAGEKWPEKFIFDFSRLSFIKPAGVVFLSNLGHWLSEQGSQVVLRNCDPKRYAIKYLDDSLFFEQHCGNKLSEKSHPRGTTRPLQQIAQQDSHAWLEANFVPWLAGRLGITQASLYTFKACVSELFNNIQDHTQYEIGSIFVQHFPRDSIITISLADFGPGIPEKVREKLPNLDDDAAIIQAVQDGFTTKSRTTNKGVGLDYLLKAVVLRNGGKVTIYSCESIVQFHRNGNVIEHRALPDVGFCPGTTIDIEIRTGTIEVLPDEREELQW